MLRASLIILALFLVFHSTYAGETPRAAAAASPKSDVYLQGFYWNSPPGGLWYDSLAKLAPHLASAGFSAIWLPSPAKGAGGGFSMGYDPYDHFDFGEYYQKGSLETRFGSRQELEHLIASLHEVGIEVFADAVMRHVNGGEERIPYECTPPNRPDYPDSAYLLYQYPNGSKRFGKSAGEFYPNSQTCDVSPPYHGASDPIFQFGEWLAHDKQSVSDSLIVWGKYLREELKFDGFRLDAVKAIDPVFMGKWLKEVNGTNYAVAEYYGSAGEIGSWLNETKNIQGGNTAMFDFPLRFTLRDMCNTTSGGFDMTQLDNAGLVNSGISGFDVSTFVENHDFDRIGWDGGLDTVGHAPIYSDKMMAYAYILFSEGRPCVFFKDYFSYGMGGRMDTLLWIRQTFLHGGTTKRGALNPYYAGGGSQEEQARDLYIARRDGGDGRPEAYLVINDHPTEWRGVWVNSSNPGTWFRDYTGVAIDKKAEADGRVELWAPPRGYAVYVPDTTRSINHEPVLQRIPDMIAYTNAPFSYTPNVVDTDGEQLALELGDHPSWLSITAGGMLRGTPAFADTGLSTIRITIQDGHGITVADTFRIQVFRNVAPVLPVPGDTTIEVTRRFELTLQAFDGDGDTLTYLLMDGPRWLSVGERSGILSGTPALEDTALFQVFVAVTDGKGGADTASFALHAVGIRDSVVGTYLKPALDGVVEVSESDWRAAWQISADSDSDSYWWKDSLTPDNELKGIFATWDADSLYLGVDYLINDVNNTLMVYVDAGILGGITNFKSTAGYNGEYPKNMHLRGEDGIDLFMAAYYKNPPSVFRIDSNRSRDITAKVHSARGPNGHDAETAIAWDDIYGLGAGLVPPNVFIKIVTVVAGGFDYGAGDSMPDNPDTDGNSGPDSLMVFSFITPDTSGDGIPDPTVYYIVTSLEDEGGSVNPAEFTLSPNYPNPFNPLTHLRFTICDLSRSSQGVERDFASLSNLRYVTLKIYTILGEEVATLVNEVKGPGSYTVSWNAGNLPSGVYIVRLSSGNAILTQKALLMK